MVLFGRMKAWPPFEASRMNGSAAFRMPSSSVSGSPGTMTSVGAKTLILSPAISVTQSVPSGPTVTSSGVASPESPGIVS